MIIVIVWSSLNFNVVLPVHCWFSTKPRPSHTRPKHLSLRCCVLSCFDILMFCWVCFAVTLSVHCVSPELSLVQSSNRHHLPRLINTLPHWILLQICSCQPWRKPTPTYTAYMRTAHEHTQKRDAWCVFNDIGDTWPLSRPPDMQMIGLIKSLVRETDLVTKSSGVVCIDRQIADH